MLLTGNVGQNYMLDVNFIKKSEVQQLVVACGVSSIGVIISLLGKIYETGYHIEFTEELVSCVASETKLKSGTIRETINMAVKVGFFNQEIFKKYSLLTSKQIQENAAQTQPNISIEPKYSLVDLPVRQAGNRLISNAQNQISENSQTRENHFKDSNIRETNSKSTGGVIVDSKEEVDIEKDKKTLSRPTDRADPPAPARPAGGERAGKKETKLKDKKVFPPESIEYRCTKYVMEKVLEFNPNNKKAPKSENDPKFQEWCVHIDRAIRLDKRPVNELRKLTKFAFEDDFWRKTIQSTSGLRENYDTIFMKMKGETTNGNNSRYSGSTKTIQQAAAERANRPPPTSGNVY